MPDPGVIKISVLAGGQVLMNGQPATLAALGLAMDAAEPGTVVWYYRENAAGAPHPVVIEVIKLITSHRLPIRLSTLPDFSDTVSAAALDPEGVFAALRARAAQRNLAILRPDGLPLLLPAPRPETAPPGVVASVEKILPSQTPRNVAAIGDTSWTMAETPSLQAANVAIPFFGILMGLAAIGHAVWVFDGGSPKAIAAGSHDADVLIVDGDRLSARSSGWQAAAAKCMRDRRVLECRGKSMLSYYLRAPGAENG